MTAVDDLKALALIDTHHGALRHQTVAYFATKGLEVFSEQAQNGEPLVAVALEFPSPFPLDPAADMRILYWLADLTQSRTTLLRAFIRSIQAINAHMQNVGATKVWGQVPKNATHMISFLDPLAARGKCTRIDGATAGDPYNPDVFAGVVFYVGIGADVTADMVARRR